MKKILLFTFGLLIFAGCTNSTKTQKTPIINENQSIYIMIPDTADTAQTYMVQSELKKNFQKLSKAKVSTALDPSSIKTGLTEAKKQKADLMVCPMITQWQDNDTPNKKTQDKIGILVKLFDVNTQEVINEQNLYKRSNKVSFKDSAPDKLLPGIIKKYVVLLYK